MSLSQPISTPAQQRILRSPAGRCGTLPQISVNCARPHSNRLSCDFDDDWADAEIWKTIKVFSPRITEGYFLNAVDMKKGFDGLQRRDEAERIYLVIFGRTFLMSLNHHFGLQSCLAIPVAVFSCAYACAEGESVSDTLSCCRSGHRCSSAPRPGRFFSSRKGSSTTFSLPCELSMTGARLLMINNQFGTIVAMSHILLPFMILPLFSVMKTIPPSYVRAAKSLGANPVTAFRRVYFPQSMPGIAAGSVLVFILAIGYYITPELVGGIKGDLYFEPDRLPYLELAELGTWRGSRVNSARRRSHSLLGL